MPREQTRPAERPMPAPRPATAAAPAIGARGRAASADLYADGMSLVTGVDFAVVPTKSFDAAVEFYETVLGLPCTARYGRMPGAEFETGNLTLAVLELEAFGAEFRPAAPIALQVDDVAAARAELESRGVAFTGDIVDSGVCHQAYFADPDGNQLILHHRYAPRSRSA